MATRVTRKLVNSPYQINTVMRKEHDVLLEEYNTLSEGYNTLSEEYNTLSETNVTCEEHHDDLLEIYEDLLEKYDDVLNEHDVLCRDCVTMYNEHNASQSHIEQLQLDVVKVSGVLPRSQMTPTHVLL